MSSHRASQLTLWGFSVLYTGLMGILVAANAPAVSRFWKPTVLALSAIVFVGLVVMLAGRLIRMDERDGT
jgi:hypothetical protein